MALELSPRRRANAPTANRADIPSRSFSRKSPGIAPAGARHAHTRGGIRNFIRETDRDPGEPDIEPLRVSSANGFIALSRSCQQPAHLATTPISHTGAAPDCAARSGDSAGDASMSGFLTHTASMSTVVEYLPRLPVALR
ncbi:hypothetical protein ACVBGC_31780 [Burkholderia stagnalis]